MGLFAAAAIAVCLPVLFTHVPPKGSGGSINLSKWNFGAGGPVPLTTGWQFSGRSGAGSETAQGTFLPIRPGVYKLALRTPPRAQSLALYLDDASDLRIYAGTRRLSPSGARSGTPFLETLSFRPATTGTTVLTIESRAAGSVSRPPILGEPGQVDRLALLALLSQAVFVGGFLLLGIYQFAVFLGRREDRASLFLALVCAAVALRTAVGGSDLPAIFLPWLTSVSRLRAELFVSFAALWAGVCFLGVAFRSQVPRTAGRVSSVVFAVGALISVGLSPSSLPWLQDTFHVLLAAYFLLMGLVAWRGVRQGADGTLLLLLGLFALAATGLHDALTVAIGLLPLPLAPVGLAVLVGTQALWLAQRTALQMHREAVLSRENERLLNRADQQLRDLRSSRTLLLEREESVRRDIAEMLHSRVQTRLLLIWHRLGDIEQQIETVPDAVRASLAAIRADLDAVRERDIREASHRLHPSVIDLGLLPALRTVADSYADRLSVRVRADRSVTALDRSPHKRFPLPLRLSIYRAVEEALQNTARHSEATRVAIYLRLRDGRLRLRVRDDGVGIDPAALSPGLGLRSIAARVALHDGTWRIISAPGQGTALEIDLPVPTPETIVGGGQFGTSTRRPS